MNKIFIIILLLISVNILHSQPSMEWMSIIKCPIIDIHSIEVPSIDMQSDSEGNVYVSYYDSSDGIYQHRITKYDAFGIQLWTYSKPAAIEVATTHLRLVGNNIFCAYQDYGYCRLVRLDNNGNVLYERALWAYWVTSFEADRRGNAYLTFRGTANNHFRTVKFDNRGFLKWDVNYNNSAEDFSCDLAVDNDFNVYVTGTTIGQGPNGAHVDILTIKYNSNGSLKWASIYNSPAHNDLAKLITLDSRGFPVVAGWTFLYGNSSFLTLKYDPNNGSLVWEQFYQTPGWGNFPRAITTDAQDNIYVSGLQVTSYYNAPILKYSPAGVLLWSHIFFGIRCEDIVVDSEQNIYVTGSNNPVGYGPSDAHVWIYDMNGNLRWNDVFDRGGNDYSYKMSISTNYNMYTMGYSQNGFDLPYITFTRKYYLPGLRPSEEPIKEKTSSSQVPANFMLYNNYPNPFNPATKIKFDIPAGNSRLVKITVYDMLGRQITDLVNQSMKPGSYETEFESSGLASGVYFYRIEAGEFTDLKKMILIK